MQDPRASDTGSVARWVGYATLIVPFVLSFFTRFAPGTFSGAVASDLGIGATELGLATGTYFYVYTAMQLPSGLIIDRYGVRGSVAAGTLVAAGGLALYSGADSLTAAVLGSALIGLGTSTSFIGLLRANAAWFSGSLFGVMSGLTLLLGNLGSVAAGEPLAALLTSFTWRQILLAAAGVCAVATLAVVLFVRLPRAGAAAARAVEAGERPRALAFLVQCCRDRVLLLLTVAAVGTNSTFYTFSGLWGTPFMIHGRDMSVAGATTVISAALLVYGLVSLVMGRIADKSPNKAQLVVVAGGLSVAGWLGILVSAGGPVSLTICAVLAAGGAAGGVVVGFSLVTEQFAGTNAATALALINGAVFLGVAVLQSAFGWVFDLVRPPAPSGDPLQSSTSDFIPGLLLLLLVSAAGMISASRVPQALARHHRLSPTAARDADGSA